MKDLLFTRNKYQSGINCSYNLQSLSHLPRLVIRMTGRPVNRIEFLKAREFLHFISSPLLLAEADA